MDRTAAYCVNCGAPVSGRFCSSCGAAVAGVPETLTREPDLLAPPPAPLPPPAPGTDDRAVGGPGPGLWIGAAAVLLVIVLLGAFLLLRGGGSPSAGPTPPIIPPKSHPTRASQTSPPTTAPTTPPTSPATSAPTGPAAEVAGLARAVAPAHAPASVDFAGNPVTYDASNLVDGAPDTCWRVAGDATGTTLTFRLDQPTRLTRVGLINGYAKTAYSRGHRFDWYAGNRQVLSVEWLFDDGSSVSQTFASTRAMQTQTIDPVTTSTVRLRITSVSPPGTGRAARDDTAISEVSLVGSPG
ncbi:NADase-type glycan-binding domain-containing protein [Nocardioides cynanchi]|uniref:NADase-type glycan-binding domain-containing protein n=1 Tax=Nocardioides cynanchi TaxID=2558918 RepID=UPI0012445381|nr:hypothetical protein [Nocardioides cynanchi]